MAKTTSPMAVDDAKWKAESDADTLIRAEEVKGDAERLKAAKAILMNRKKSTDKAVGKVDDEKSKDSQED
jgi:hypothetical protein